MNKNKENIMQSFMELVIEQGSTNIAVTDICKRASVSRGTFYKLFNDKYNIIETFFLQDVLNPISVYFDGPLTPHEITKLWYLNFYNHKDFYKIAIKEIGQNSLTETIIDHLYYYNFNKTFDYVEDKVIRDYLSYKYASSQALFLKKWMNDGMAIPPETMVKMFFHGINEQWE